MVAVWFTARVGVDDSGPDLGPYMLAPIAVMLVVSVMLRREIARSSVKA